MKALISVVSILLTICTLTHSTSGYVYWRNATKRAVGSVIPKPMEMTLVNGEDYASIVRSDLDISYGDDIEYCAIVSAAVDRYKNYYFFDDVKPEDKDLAVPKRTHLGRMTTLRISKDPSLPVEQSFKCDSMPDAEMIESYKLSVTRENEFSNQFIADLSASSCWGILRGLETFSQMIINLAPGSFGIRPVFVSDEPRFKHRGFMLDTARHYISLDKIIKLLDAMAMNKLNVFHWHLVDDQSFPLKSRAYPQLSANTSFRPGLVYSQSDVKFVIEYAATRGIRVMPELDTPGHSYALRFIDNLLSECYDPKTRLKNGDFGPIDPTRESSYTKINKLLKEFGEIFPDRFFHAGGDEVDFDCWKSNPLINRWMEEKNITAGDYKSLSNYYLRKLYKLIKAQHKQMIVWQEVFDFGANLPIGDTVIHVWKNINDAPQYMAELKRVVEAGYNALLSSCWYLNYIDYGQDWVKFYKCDPTKDLEVSNKLKHLVLGGEICMWTEFVDDSNVISRTWPRASAAAERLWSSESANDTSEFLHRLEQMRCRLVYRTIDAEPVNGPGYC